MCLLGRATAMDRERPPPCCRHRRPAQGLPLPHPADLRRQCSLCWAVGPAGCDRVASVRKKEKLRILRCPSVVRGPCSLLGFSCGPFGPSFKCNFFCASLGILRFVYPSASIVNLLCAGLPTCLASVAVLLGPASSATCCSTRRYVDSSASLFLLLLMG